MDLIFLFLVILSIGGVVAALSKVFTRNKEDDRIQEMIRELEDKTEEE